jgi:hypothetical protein
MKKISDYNNIEKDEINELNLDFDNTKRYNLTAQEAYDSYLPELVAHFNNSLLENDDKFLHEGNLDDFDFPSHLLRKTSKEGMTENFKMIYLAEVGFPNALKPNVDFLPSYNKMKEHLESYGHRMDDIFGVPLKFENKLYPPEKKDDFCEEERPEIIGYNVNYVDGSRGVEYEVEKPKKRKFK